MVKKELKEGNLVLCKVTKIERTTVFVKMNGKEGTIITSEIAPGRIRNIRDYVVPGKIVVCKVLSIDKQGNIHLSLRRVTDKEKRGVLEASEREKSSLNILKSVVKEKAEDIAEKIKKKGKSLYDFLQACKQEPAKLEKYLTREEAEKICKILEERREKQVEVKKQFSLTSKESNGLTRLKRILLPYKESVSYITAGKFLLRVRGENYKEANKELEQTMSEIQVRAKEENCEFTEEK